jgi:hypothetical protein
LIRPNHTSFCPAPKGALTDLEHAARFEMPRTSHDSLVDQINGGLAI